MAGWGTASFEIDDASDWVTGCPTLYAVCKAWEPRTHAQWVLCGKEAVIAAVSNLPLQRTRGRGPLSCWTQKKIKAERPGQLAVA
jgi:hypothetical protein